MPCARREGARARCGDHEFSVTSKQTRSGLTRRSRQRRRTEKTRVGSVWPTVEHRPATGGRRTPRGQARPAPSYHPAIDVRISRVAFAARMKRRARERNFALVPQAQQHIEPGRVAGCARPRGSAPNNSKRSRQRGRSCCSHGSRRAGAALVMGGVHCTWLPASSRRSRRNPQRRSCPRSTRSLRETSTSPMLTPC